MKAFSSFLGIVLLFSCLTVAAQKKGEMPFTTSSKEASAEVRKGLENFSNAKIADGNANMQKAIELDPQFAMAHILLFNGRVNRLNNLEKASSMNMSEYEERILKGVKGSLENSFSEGIFDPIFKKYPRDYQLITILCFSIPDKEKVVSIMESLLKRNKKFGPAYNLLGYTYMNQGDMGKAENAFNNYIKYDPEEANPYDSKADWFMRMGQYQEAMESYEKAYQLGMAVSYNRSRIAWVRANNPDLSENDVKNIGETITNSGKAMVKGDFDVFLDFYSDQAIEIFADQRVNVGKYNLKNRLISMKNNGWFTQLDIEPVEVFGIGNVSLAYATSKGTFKNNAGKEFSNENKAIMFLRKDDGGKWLIVGDHFYGGGDTPEMTNQDRSEIFSLTNKWASLIDTETAFSEETIQKYRAIYSAQALEILPNLRANVGFANIHARWKGFIGSQFTRSSLNLIDIYGDTHRAMGYGVVIQEYKDDSNSEVIKNAFPVVFLFTKEKDQWKILFQHWVVN